jgi:hypothetical protein
MIIENDENRYEFSQMPKKQIICQKSQISNLAKEVKGNNKVKVMKHVIMTPKRRVFFKLLKNTL